MRFVHYTILTGKVNAPAVVRVAGLGAKRGYFRVVARRDAHLGYRIAVDGGINAVTAPEARDAVSRATAQLTFTNDIIPAAACSKVWQCHAQFPPDSATKAILIRCPAPISTVSRKSGVGPARPNASST